MQPEHMTKDDYIKRLENDLWEAQTTVLELMPNALEMILRSYADVESSKESYRWQHMVAQKIVTHAIPLESEGRRGNCPLCGRGSMSPYEQGFALPEGLSRHLTGYGNTIPCRVMVVVMSLAHNLWREKFSESDRIAEIAEQELLKERRKTEMLYQTELNGKPHLYDENTYGEQRDEASLLATETRLTLLNFSKTVENNVTRYIRNDEQFTVYADPRRIGHITFRVYKKYSPAFKGTVRPCAWFDLQDRFKNDLSGLYMKALNKALGVKNS